MGPFLQERKKAPYFSLQNVSAADKLINLKSTRIFNFFSFHFAKENMRVCGTYDCKLAVDGNDIDVCYGHSRFNDQVISTIFSKRRIHSLSNH